MKQVAQNYRSGELSVLDVPPPTLRPGGVLVRSLYSLISTGTEVMKVKEARLSLAGKARARPEQVRQVVDTVTQQGPMAAYKKVMTKLDAYTPLGYSLCGVVEQVGAGAEEFTRGSAGRVRRQRARAARRGQLGTHQSLRPGSGWRGSQARRVRHGRGDRHAGRQAVRGPARRHRLRHRSRSRRTASRAAPRRGRSARGRPRHGRGALQDGREGGRHGVRLPGARGRRARRQASRRCDGWSRRRSHPHRRRRHFERTGRGGRKARKGQGNRRRHRQDPSSTCPGTPITTRSSTSRFSRSYGPGRYDDRYELEGIDYPAGYVRWTERRNLACFVDLSGQGRARRRVACFGHLRESSSAVDVYDRLSSGDLHGVGFLFEYPAGPETTEKKPDARASAGASTGQAGPQAGQPVPLRRGSPANGAIPSGSASSGQGTTRRRCCSRT